MTETNWRHGPMTREDFLALDPRPLCPECEQDTLDVYDEPPGSSAVYSVRCNLCRNYDGGLRKFRWLRKDENTGKARRKPLAPDEMAAIWLATENRCAVCGVRRDAFDRLGLRPEIHHVIAYAMAEDAGPKLGMCHECHRLVSAQQANRRQQYERRTRQLKIEDDEQKRRAVVEQVQTLRDRGDV